MSNGELEKFKLGRVKNFTLTRKITYDPHLSLYAIRWSGSVLAQSNRVHLCSKVHFH